MRNQLTNILSYSTALLLLSMTSAGAQSIELPGITVTADKIASGAGVQVDDFPGNGTTVTAEDIEKITTPNVEDVIKYESNVFVRKRFTGDNNATTAVRAMHHFQTPRVLVYSDGLLLSNFLGANYGTAPRWSVTAPHEVESASVLYGPFSAQLPGNSMGGTVVLNTKMPEGPEAFFKASSFHQGYNYYKTDDMFSGKAIYGSVGGKEGNTSIRFSVNHLENDSQPMSFRFLRNGGSGGTTVTGAVFDEAAKKAGQRSGYAYAAQDFHHKEDTLLKGKMRHKFNKNWSADLTLAYWNSKNDREKFETYLRDANGNKVFVGDVTVDGVSLTARNSDLYYRVQEKNDLLSGLTVRGKDVGGFDIESTISFYTVLDDETRRANGYTESQSNGSGRIDNANGTGWQTFDLKASRSISNVLVTTGYHFDHYKAEKESFNTDAWRTGAKTSLRNANGGDTSTHGAFLEAKFEPLNRVEVTTGVRFDYWEAFDGYLKKGTSRDQHADRSDEAVSPKFAVSYKATNDLTLDFAAGMATRFPTVGELFQGSLDSDGNFDPNSFDPNLKPEKSKDLNVSATQIFGGSSFKATAFLSYVDDTIFRQRAVNPNTGATSNAFLNIPEMRNYGVEVSFKNNKTLIPGLQIAANASYTRAEILSNPGNLGSDGLPDTEGNQLPRVPLWRAAVTLSYEATERLILSAGYRYSSTPYTDLENTLKGETVGYTSGYSVLDLKAEYELFDDVKLNVAMDNVTDEDYFAYHAMPGRTFTVGMKAKF